jgi:arylsulfatase A-like enzyme
MAFPTISSQNEKEKNKKGVPNIVLLLGDDHDWEEVGYNSHPFVKTPVLDEMAAVNVQF